MSYRTTCSRCTSVFRLGADQLDAAQGWVQCSVCGNAFDAHLSLLMEDGSPVPEPDPVAPPQPQPSPAPLDETIAVAVAADAGMAGDGDPAAPEPLTDIEDLTPSGITQRETPFDLPSIILIDPDAAEADDPGPLPQIHAPAYPSRSSASAYPPAPAVHAPARPSARIEYAGTPPRTTRTQKAPRRSRPWVWALASVLLVVGLLVQTTYFLRDSLVSRLPQTRSALEQACAALGCRLSLSKNLALLQIVGSDLQTEASGRLKLTLTLGNRSGQVQAWPVLVLTLTDQRNRPLARRSFAPSEYLGDGRQIAAGLPPRSEQPLSLPLNVRNLAPMGFDLQLTY